MKFGVKEMVAAAEKNIEAISIDEAEKLLEDDDVVFVDIRDVRELWREGKLPGATHAPRGMLEFWVDPESPYHREMFAEDKRLVFYCASAWRSALATDTLQQMGMENICHLSGGFSAWKEAEKPIEAVEKK
jgi:rhodanese-related sulfurtransferase